MSLAMKQLRAAVDAVVRDQASNYALQERLCERIDSLTLAIKDDAETISRISAERDALRAERDALRRQHDEMRTTLLSALDRICAGRLVSIGSLHNTYKCQIAVSDVAHWRNAVAAEAFAPVAEALLTPEAPAGAAS